MSTPATSCKSPAKAGSLMSSEWVRSFFWTSVFCLAIAILLWVLEVSRPFWLSASVAFCIGWSICTAHFILLPRLEDRIGSIAATTLATLLGLFVAIGIISIFLNQSGFTFNGLEPGSAALAIFFGVLGTIVFSNMHHVHEMREALSNAELEQLNTERRLSEAKLKTLQAQIEPHFLFNTLSTAMGLIRTDPPAAEETLQQLTTLLRNSLSRTRESATTLAQELDLVRAYLRIQQIRMGARLEFDVTCPLEFADQTLPPLLVQPLVENALTHGLEPAESGGSVTVTVEHVSGNQSEGAPQSDSMRIVIADTGLGLENTKSTAGHGTGLSNVRERLLSLYGHEAGLQLAPNSPSGVVATLVIPTRVQLNPGEAPPT